MAKGDKFYFENFIESTKLAEKAALYLVECLENYDPANIETMLQEMHSIEHAADGKKHEMSAALAKAFVTPVDREDLDMLSRNLDEVPDNIEEILQKFYIYNIKSIEPSVVEFAKKLAKRDFHMREAVAVFFSKMKKFYLIHRRIFAMD